MASLGNDNSADNSEDIVTEQPMDVKMELDDGVDEAKSTTAGPQSGGGTKRKASPTAGISSSPQSPPTKKKKSLKLRLSLSGSGTKQVKIVDPPPSADAPNLRPTPFPDGANSTSRVPDGPPVTGTSTSTARPAKPSSSSRRIKLSLPKTSASSMIPPVVKTNNKSVASVTSTGGAGNGNSEAVKKQRRSSTGRFASKNPNSVSNSNSNNNSKSLVNATILPMTSPGLMVVGAGKNNLIAPRVIFDQAMESAGYTTESRTQNPHRGSSVKRVVGDMFDSTTTVRLHFPRLVPNHFLKRPDSGEAQPKPPAVSAMPTHMTPPRSAKATATTTTNTTACTINVDKNDSSEKTDVGTKMTAVEKAVVDSDQTSKVAVPVQENESTDVVTTDVKEEENANVKEESEDVIMETQVSDESSAVKKEDYIPPSDSIHDHANNQSNAGASNTETVTLAAESSAKDTADDAFVKDELKDDVKSHQQAHGQRQNENETALVTSSDAKPKETASNPVVEDASKPKLVAQKTNDPAHSLASPTRFHKGEKKPSLADRLIKAFSRHALGASKSLPSGNTKAKIRPSNLRTFAGMIPMSLTLPYPDDYILRQAKYMKEVKQREKAIAARQQDTEAIEIDKEAAEMLDRQYVGPATSKIPIPPIPQPPRPPKITDMKKLDPAIFGQNGEDRLYPLKNTKNEHLDPHCFHITEGRYFGLECNHTFDPNWNGPNAPGFNGMSMTSTNSLAGAGGSSVPLLTASAVALLEANAKSEEASATYRKLKGEKKKPGTVSSDRPPQKRDENGKFISAKKDVDSSRSGTPVNPSAAQTTDQPAKGAEQATQIKTEMTN